MTGEKVSSGIVIDEMLKKLGRFLRIAGFDVLIPEGLNDRKLAALSMDQGRILITRDKDLSNMNGPETLRIISDDISTQMEEIGKSKLKEKVPRTTTRCPICGEVLDWIEDSEKLPEGSEVPEKIKRIHDTFYVCPSCKKVYWRGSHWERIVGILKKARLDPLAYE